MTCERDATRIPPPASKGRRVGRSRRADHSTALRAALLPILPAKRAHCLRLVSVPVLLRRHQAQVRASDFQKIADSFEVVGEYQFFGLICMFHNICVVQGYAQRAGLSVHVTTHTFGRSCATEMLRGGANMYHVKELLGHERLDTLKHYV